MENTNYKVLLVEDDKIDQIAFERAVKENSLPYDYKIASTVEEAKSVLHSEQFDVVITDYFFGGSTAFELLDSTKDMPVIITTGEGSERIAVKAMKAGVCDYLVKDLDRKYLDVLPVMLDSVIKHRRAERQMKECERLKSEFVATVSHELRTPLCIFKNILSNAMADVLGPISPKLRTNLEIADKTVDRLARIINDFLDISKIEAGRMKLELKFVNIRTVISEVIDSMIPLANAKNLELKAEMPLEDIIANIDCDRIKQVLTNLIGNAIKFTPSDGHVNVYLEDCGEEVKVEVNDDGAGIPEEVKSKIFMPFVQGHKLLGPGEHGTGLGLSISKELVRLHGGRIWAENAPDNKGCSFLFVLPKEHPDDAQKGVIKELQTEAGDAQIETITSSHT